MSKNRYNPKRDANEPEIVNALYEIVDSKEDIERNNGTDEPDLRVWYRDTLYWLEVKTKTGRLSDGQRIWIERAILCGQNVFVVRSVDDALRAIGAMD